MHLTLIQRPSNITCYVKCVTAPKKIQNMYEIIRETFKKNVAVNPFCQSLKFQVNVELNSSAINLHDNVLHLDVALNFITV